MISLRKQNTRWGIGGMMQLERTIGDLGITVGIMVQDVGSNGQKESVAGDAS